MDNKRLLLLSASLFILIACSIAVVSNGGMDPSADTSLPGGTTEPASSSSRLYFEVEQGSVTAILNNNGQESDFQSGSILSEGYVSLVYNVPESFEFINWIIISGDSIDESRKDRTIRIASGDYSQDVRVSANLRYYSQSNVLSNLFHFDSPTSSSDIHTLWRFLSSKTVGGQGMGIWKTTCVPLVVDDYVYAYTGDELYKLEGSTGEILAKTYVEELNNVYYRYLGYGGGYILDFNSDKVFDLDLNLVCSINGDLKASFYDNGVNYGLFYDNGLKLKQFTIDSSGVKYTGGFNVDVDDWYNNFYGTTSAPVIFGKYLYYLSATETKISGSTVPYKIFLNSVDLSSGAKKKTDLGLDYKYLDDGWLTTDGKYLYLTSYVGGLKTGEDTGEQNSSVYENKNSSVTRISVDESGNMSKDFEVDFGYKGITSQFVVYKGRGYVNVNDPSSPGYAGFLLVYDMQSLSADSKPIYVTESTYTHGSIVLNVKNVDGDEKVYIYMISYDLRSKGVVVIEDYAGKTESTKAILLKTDDLVNYCSQGVRFLPNGSIVFYHDPGNIFCLGPAKLNEFFCFLNDGTNGKWISGTGSTVDAAFRDSGLIRIGDSKTVLGATIDSSSAPTAGWDVYYLNKNGKWIKSTGRSIDGTQDDLKGRHYWQIVKTESYTESGSMWTYEGGEYAFSPVIGSRDILNKTLTYGDAAIQHAIILPTGIDATVSSSVQSASKGETVDVTVKPKSGFYIYSVGYQVSGSQTVLIGTIGSDVYRFSMPAADVSIIVDVKPLLTVTYHTGDGAGRNVDVYVRSKTVVYDLTVYDGYKLTLRYRNAVDKVSECPIWLKEVSRWEYSGTVSGGDSVFKSLFSAGGFAGMVNPTINLRVNTYTDLQKDGTILLNDIPEGVTNAGREFLGWSTTPGATSAEFTAGQEYDLVSDVDLYAVWSGQSAYHTITLDLAGGVSESVSAEAGWIYDNEMKIWSKQFASGAAFPTISDPTKAADSINSYAFSSWNESFPEKVTESKTYVANYTETAIPAVVKYNVELPTDIEASITASPSSASKDEMVEITVDPKAGYRVDSVGYRIIGSQEPLEFRIEKNEAGIYTFSMPAADVSIEVHLVSLYTITYHTGSGQDVTYTLDVSKSGTTNLKVYDGYELEIKLSQKPNGGVQCPDWLKSEDGMTYRGTVSGGNTTFKTTNTIVMPVPPPPKPVSFVHTVNLEVDPCEIKEEFKGGIIRLNGMPEDLSKPGMWFWGWSISPNATYVDYRAGQEYDLSSDVDLYAVWLSEEPRIITLDLAGGVSESVSAEAGWIYDNEMKIWSKQFASGAAFPTISDPTKAADSINSYAFSSWNETFPEKVTESKTYTANYTEAAVSGSIRYDVECTAQVDSGSMRTYTLKIDRSSGIIDIEDARILVIANYGGQFVNVYSKIDLDNGHAVEKVRLSITGLTGLTFDIVSGFPEGTYENHGTLTPDLT